MTRHGSLAEQLANFGSQPPKAANDNRKPKQPRYSGTLPALRWLFDNHPDLAPAFAEALPRPPANWFVDVEPTRQEIRPTVGELMSAAHDKDGNARPITFCEYGTSIGSLRFRNGILVEWGVTKKGKKLKPTDRPRVNATSENKKRNPEFYLSRTPTTPSPMAADHCHRDFQWGKVLPPMYDPLPGVEAARRQLAALGVDGSVPAGCLPYGVTCYQDGVAEGAEFLGGVCSPSGNSSSGALMWETPEPRPSDAVEVIEEVAARGTLKSIGLRLGYSEDYADRGGKNALVEIAEILFAMSQKKKSA